MGRSAGRNPLVLIHAPLYYHLAALMAWPLVPCGVDPVSAALAAGRSLSFLGLASRWRPATGWPGSTERLAERVVGHALIAASPVVGAIPFTVRPDMLGVALQTTGVLLVFSVLRSERPRA